MPDIIHIQGLQTVVRLGVPAEERLQWQTVEVDVTLTPKTGFADLGDAIERTVDYGRVAVEIREVAAIKPRALIETLAEDVAAHLLERFALEEIRLTIRKFVIPGAQWVAVSMARQRVRESNP